jgi:DUF4097 and DUF4098 domain-containing protein YvlB
VSARKIGLLLLILAFGAVVETAWSVRGDLRIGPEGCRVIRGRFYGPSFTYETEAERALAGPALVVEVRNAFGAVTVTGGPAGTVRVKLRKVVYLATEDKARAFADRVQLKIEEDGGRLRVGTNRDELERGEDVGLETHLELIVPEAAAVEVHDEHGRVELAEVASADVTSSFDDVAVSHVPGRVKVDARHGGVRVSGVGSELDVQSRHGDVEVAGVAGPVKVDAEHGKVTARHTAGVDLAVRFGDVLAEGVGGDLVVRAVHAGVTASDVVGRADVETSFGDVSLARVGSVGARVEHGRVEATDVSGAARVETSHNDLRLERVGGPVQATVQHGSVDAQGLAHGATVRSSGGDVTLQGFRGPVDVDLDRGGARLEPRAPVTDPINASVRNGSLTLEVPEGSRFDLDAESRRGEVEADVPALATSGREEHRRGEKLTARIGGGGALVRLRSEGDLRIGSVPAGALATPAPPAPAGSGTDEPTPTRRPAEAPAQGPTATHPTAERP